MEILKTIVEGNFKFSQQFICYSVLMLSRHEMQKYTGYADDDPSLEGPERICVFVPLIHSVKINAFTANISEAS